MTEKNKLPHVVILGAGFGGITCVQKLLSTKVRITVIDRQNHHLFQPLLYQVATAGLAPSEIAYPVRNLFGRKKNAQVLMGTALGFDFDKKQILLRDRTVDYDYLVIAVGGRTSYFGNDHWAEHAWGLKTIKDALAIRHRLLLAYERAENEKDEALRKKYLTTVVVGGGPTGVEMAGAVAELAKRVLAPDYSFPGRTEGRIILVEAAPRILPMFHPSLSAKAQKQLESLGVEVRIGEPVKDIREGAVVLEKEVLPAEHIIWGAGVEGTSLVRSIDTPQDRAGRLLLGPDLRLPEHPEVYALGDAVSLQDASGKPVPGVAPAAMQMGKFIARDIRRRIDGKDPVEKGFVYFDKGMMATVGRGRAIAEVGKLRFSGFFAWLAWLFVHLLFLVGAHNKVFVVMDWIYNYISFGRGARLIIRSHAEADPAVEKATSRTPTDL
ncbi:MAG: NAD(P)/FAD-dependent oxidoreductase [Opitutales bacterium]|nr:NAD(P)/FAD-dependent oxidoreductase [Opitutales bacterium]